MSVRSSALLLASTAVAAALAFGAHAEEADAVTVDGLVVEGGRASTSAVTGLDLTLSETPQSVSVMERDRIEDFSLVTVNELLAQVVGVNVEQVETDRTYYNARGFDITTFQVDGVGLPLRWGIQFGDLDTALFERVEVVRGATGLTTGVGNPSAAVNYVRKRPTAERQGRFSAQYGSWNDKRIEADVSGPLNASGTVRGRLVYANQDRDSYLDHNAVNRNVYYGVIAWDAAPNLTLTAGFSRQDNRADGVLWGALPLLYSDGTAIAWPDSASTSADWTYWDVDDKIAFAEAEYRFAGDWRLKAVATYRRADTDAKLLYAFGNPDPATGLGVAGMSGVYPSRTIQKMFDIEASGPFQAFGREHRLVVGAHASETGSKEWEGFSATYPIYPAVGLWAAQQVAEPAYPDKYLAEQQTDKMQRIYAAAHLNFTDRLKGVVGVSALKLKSTGFSYGVDKARDEDAVSPYVGLLFDLTPNLTAYASYTDIFNPQSEVDVARASLPAAHGKSYELGLKSQWFDNRLYATASVFKSEQFDLAEWAGAFPDGKSYYAGVDTFVEGFELEAAGRITDRWTLSGGYTNLSIEGENGQDVRTYLPRKTIKAATTYAVPELRNLKLGAAVRWQDDVYIEDIATLTQKAYAVLDLTAGVDVTPQVRATLNVKNATDKTHLTSLMWNQSYYAAPRSVSLRIDYAF